jgi:L-ascorbate 6-phosphate lactonase
VLTWLGQAGARLEIDGIHVLIDPWLSPHEDRLVPPPPLDLAADGVDVLLVTHEHLDHLDLPFLPQLLERSPSVRVVLPAPLAPLVEEHLPAPQLVPVQPSDGLELEGLSIDVTPAYHGVTMEDAYGDGSAIDGRPRFVGYVLGAEERVYHAGDTIVTDELIAALGPLRIDVALLPINGRDAEREGRGIVGNMDAAEAVSLAIEIGATTLVPIHWDGFAGNTASPDDAVAAAGDRLRVVVPERVEAFALR